MFDVVDRYRRALITHLSMIGDALLHSRRQPRNPRARAAVRAKMARKQRKAVVQEEQSTTRLLRVLGRPMVSLRRSMLRCC
jgi:formamidopyrimidine-DNA glycosylase